MNLWDHDNNHRVYVPHQFHFHSPSEHTVDGFYMDLEMHIVTYDPRDEKYAVIAVFYQLTQEDVSNPFLDKLDLNNLGSDLRDFTIMDLMFNLTDSPTMLQYTGSFTTPPCTEGVTFNVVMQPQPISSAQLSIF